MFHGKMPAVIQMKKYFETTEFPTDAKLQALLQKRRAPLAAAAMQETLRELTWYLSGPVRQHQLYGGSAEIYSYVSLHILSYGSVPNILMYSSLLKGALRPMQSYFLQSEQLW